MTLKLSMKVGWIVFVVEHTNDDSEESGNFGHRFAPVFKERKGILFFSLRLCVFA
jgi:hypothetical protein